MIQEQLKNLSQKLISHPTRATLTPKIHRLGLIQIAIIPIPVLFYKYGDKIRMRSTLIRTMQEDKERLEVKRRSGITVAQRDKEEEKIVKIASKTAQP